MLSKLNIKNRKLPLLLREGNSLLWAMIDWNSSRLMYTFKYPWICQKPDEGFSVGCLKSKIWHLQGGKQLCGRLEIVKDGGRAKNLNQGKKLEDHNIFFFLHFFFNYKATFSQLVKSLWFLTLIRFIKHSVFDLTMIKKSLQMEKQKLCW